MSRTRIAITAILSCLLSASGAGGVAAQGASISDLAIEKTADQEVLPLGDEVTYTITVANTGPDLANDVVMTDHLPVTMDPISITASGIGTCSLSPTISCTFASIPVGGEETVTLDASPLDTGLVVNEASVSSDSVDFVVANDRSMVALAAAPEGCTVLGTPGNDELTGRIVCWPAPGTTACAVVPGTTGSSAAAGGTFSSAVRAATCCWVVVRATHCVVVRNATA